MSIFNYTNEELASLKATFTATEIHQQPSTWEKTIEQVRSRAEEIKAFIAKVIDQDDYDVVLTELCYNRLNSNTRELCIST